MPWRLIVFITVFAVFLVFITLNLNEENKCDISFGFTVIEDFPVYLTIFFSFALGLICALPVAIRVGKRRRGLPEKEKKSNKKDTGGSSRGSLDGTPNAAN